MKYRSDIDGLRAVAVLIVVAFHASPVRATGGFVGVDVFFVISGFLISTILFEGLESGRFDLLDFYGRRVRRIFPALLAVLLGVSAFGWLTLTPDELRELGKHIAGATAFVSNLVLWNESGYFDSAAEAKPLLHLWSLGIEEQFYVIWPALLWLAWRMRIRWLTVIVIGMALSFAVNVWQVQSDKVGAFYSPVARIWELLAGAGLACLSREGRVFRPVMADGASVVGLLVLVGCIFVMNTDRAFPGWWALMPVSAAALLISAGTGAVVNRLLLSNPLMVGIGLISYPLYLWHWPLLSFAKIMTGDGDPGRGVRAVAVMAAVALAWITYEFIERPIRKGRLRSAVVYPAVAMVVVGLVGISAFVTGGYPGRAVMLQQVVRNQGDIGHQEFWRYLDAHFYQCPSLSDEIGVLKWDPSIRCRQSKSTGPVRMVILGDSHAESLFPGMAERLSAANVAYYTKGELPFLTDRDFALMYRLIAKDREIDTIIISAYWHYRLDPRYNREIVPDAAGQLSEGVRFLIAANKRVYLALDVPDFTFQPRRCKYERSLLSESRCSDPRSVFDSQNTATEALLTEVKRQNPSVRIINTGEAFCDAIECKMAIDGLLMFRDPHHLSINGTRFVADQLMAANPQISELGRRAECNRDQSCKD